MGLSKLLTPPLCGWKRGNTITFPSVTNLPKLQNHHPEQSLPTNYSTPSQMTPNDPKLLNKFPCPSHETNSSAHNDFNNSNLLLCPRRINKQILLWDQRPCKRHPLTPLLRDDLLTIRRAEAEMQRVITTANSRMNMGDLPLVLLGNLVWCCDVVGEEKCITGLLQDGSLNYDMG